MTHKHELEWWNFSHRIVCMHTDCDFEMDEKEIMALVEKHAAQPALAPDAANRRCPECRAMLEENSVYCDTCGTDTPRR